MCPPLVISRWLRGWYRSSLGSGTFGRVSMSVITPAVAASTATPRQALTGTLGMDADALKHSVLRHLEYTLAELPRHVDSEWEPYMALALAVRDRLIQRWIRTQGTYYEQDPKRVRYLSPE